MKQRKFRWGIIGVGKIARYFARDLALVNTAELYAVASRSQARADEFAAEFGVEKAFGDYESMLSSGVDAIYVATRHPQHCEVAKMCLAAEIPVLCEKPLAMNLREVKEMTELARRNATFLMEAIWTNFIPTHRKIFEVLEQGELGDVLMIKAEFGFHNTVDPNSRLWSVEMGGGSLLDIGIYPLFLAQKILGSPETIEAQAAFADTGADAETLMQLRYQGNRFAHLHATLRATTENSAQIFGTKGSLKIKPRWHESSGFEITFNKGEKRSYTFDLQGAKGYLFEIKHVMECVNSGKTESPLLPLSFSENLMETMDRVRGVIGLKYPQDA